MADLVVVICVAFDHRADPDRLELFKKCICHCAHVEVAMEVSGAFDMIVHGRIATLADYTRQMDCIRPQIAEFVDRIEVNFVGRKIERHPELENFIWVPCEGGRKRIEVGKIDKVVAEGDYMRLCIGDWSCLVHSTIRALNNQLDDRFIQLHRSSIVRIDFLDRLMHQERRWVAHLRDGSHQPVAKSHVSAVLELMASDSSKHEHVPTKPKTIVEELPQSNELRMQSTH